MVHTLIPSAIQQTYEHFAVSLARARLWVSSGREKGSPPLPCVLGGAGGDGVGTRRESWLQTAREKETRDGLGNTLGVGRGERSEGGTMEAGNRDRKSWSV